MLWEQSSAVRLSVCLWASETAALLHAHSRTEQMCSASLLQGKWPTYWANVLYTISKSSTDLHTSCAASQTQLCVYTHLQFKNYYFFFARPMVLTAEAQHVVVHFVSVTFKQLCSHIHHVFKRLHLSKRNTCAWAWVCTRALAPIWTCMSMIISMCVFMCMDVWMGRSRIIAQAWMCVYMYDNEHEY